jgi:hypothetical protein
MFAGYQLGVAFMAFGAGVGRDALGTYMPAFLPAREFLCLAAAAAFGLVRRPLQATDTSLAGTKCTFFFSHTLADGKEISAGVQP